YRRLDEIDIQIFGKKIGFIALPRRIIDRGRRYLTTPIAHTGHRPAAAAGFLGQFRRAAGYGGVIKHPYRGLAFRLVGLFIALGFLSGFLASPVIGPIIGTIVCLIAVLVPGLVTCLLGRRVVSGGRC